MLVLGRPCCPGRLESQERHGFNGFQGVSVPHLDFPPFGFHEFRDRLGDHAAL